MDETPKGSESHKELISMGSSVPLAAWGIAWEISLLCCGALVHRLVVLALTTSIASDGSYYIWSAEFFAEGKIHRGLENFGGYHPLYPFCVAALGRVLGSLELAGYLISVVAGSLVVAPLYFLVRGLWSAKIARFACLLYALHPEIALESAEVMPTGLYLFCFVTTVSLFTLGMRLDSWLLLSLGGLGAGLTYLVKAEGLYVLMFLVVGGVAEAIRRLFRRDPRSWILVGKLAAAVVVVVCIAMPYMLWMRKTTGRWVLTKRHSALLLWEKLSTSSEARATPSAPAGDVERSNPGVVLRKLQRAFSAVLIPFLVAGIAVSRRMGGRGMMLWMVFALGVACLVPPCLAYSIDAQSRPSHRYFLISVILFMPWMAAGFNTFSDWLVRRTGRKAVAVMAIIVLALALLPRSMHRRRPEERSYLQVGRWLREHSPMGALRVLGTSEKFAYYAGADFIELLVPRDRTWWKFLPKNESDPDPSNSFEKAREGVSDADGAYVTADIREVYLYYRFFKASFLVLDDHSLRYFHVGMFKGLEAIGFEQVAEFPVPADLNAKKVWVYRRKVG